MNDIIHTSKYLFIISAFAGLLLALTEYVTAPKIAENKIKVLESAIKEVLPNAAKFEKFVLNDISFTLGFDNSGKYIGAAQTVAPKGYAGPIEMVVGISHDLKISGVKIQSMKETPGLGTKLSGDFLKKFLNLAQNNVNAKFYVQKDGGDVEAITGATISSRAFCSGIREAINNYTKNLSAINSAVNSKLTNNESKSNSNEKTIDTSSNSLSNSEPSFPSESIKNPSTENLQNNNEISNNTQNVINEVDVNQLDNSTHASPSAW